MRQTLTGPPCLALLPHRKNSHPGDRDLSSLFSVWVSKGPNELGGQACLWGRISERIDGEDPASWGGVRPVTVVITSCHPQDGGLRDGDVLTEWSVSLCHSGRVCEAADGM